jgi:hypothetical protein
MSAVDSEWWRRRIVRATNASPATSANAPVSSDIGAKHVVAFEERPQKIFTQTQHLRPESNGEVSPTDPVLPSPIADCQRSAESSTLNRASLSSILAILFRWDARYLRARLMKDFFFFARQRHCADHGTLSGRIAFETCAPRCHLVQPLTASSPRRAGPFPGRSRMTSWPA